MIPTIYEMQDACVLADAGTVLPVSLSIDHPALIIPMAEINVRWHEAEYRIGNGESLFLQPTEATLILDTVDAGDMSAVHVILFERYQLSDELESTVTYRRSREGLPEQACVIKFPRHLHGVLEDLGRRVMNAVSPSRHPRISAMLNDLLHQVFVHWSEAEGHYVQDMTIQQICVYMQQHLDADLTRSGMARMTGFNPSYFSSLFRKETGWSFGDYLNRLRLDEAKRQLLATSDSLQEIAARTGFSDGSYLSKTFKKHVHVTTSAFRNLQSTQRVAALQFNGALLAVGITPVLATKETAKSSLLIQGELNETIIADNQELIDRVREVQPDLIVAPTYYYHFPELLKELEQIAPTITLEWGKADKLQEVRQIGEWFNRRQEAEQWIGRYAKQAEEARERLKQFILPGQTVGLYEWNYDQRWLIPHDKVRSAYNLYRALGLTPAARIQSDVLEHDKPLFIEEADMPHYAADHMFVILPDAVQGDVVERLLSRQMWRELITEHGCSVYPLVLNEFWMDDGLSLEKQLHVLVASLAEGNKSQPMYTGQTQP